MTFSASAKYCGKILGIGQKRCKNCFAPFFPGSFEERYPASGLCADCQKLLAPSSEIYCKYCGNLLHENSAKRICKNCLKEKPAWDAIAFHGIYKDELRDLLLKFKFGSALYLAPLFANLLLQASACLQKPDVLVAVPMYHTHIFRRGFNQAHEICRALVKESGFRFSDSLLVRTRKTRAQEELSAQERSRNLINSFKAHSDVNNFHHIWLIDDILTTGTTMRECCMELKKAGARKVSVLFVARTTL